MTRLNIFAHWVLHTVIRSRVNQLTRIKSSARPGLKLTPLFLVGLFTIGLRADEPASVLADRLPESTILYMGWSPDAAVADTAAGKMFADERMTRPWINLFQSNVSGKAHHAFSFFVMQNLPKLLDSAVRSPGAFALLDFKEEKDHRAIQAVLILDLKGHREEFEAKFNVLQVKAKEILGENLQMMKFSKSWLWTTTFHDKPLFTWGFIGDSFYFYLGDQAEKILPTLLEKNPRSLADSKLFAESLAKLPGKSLVSTYVQPGPVLKIVRGWIGRQGTDFERFLTANWAVVGKEFAFDNAKAFVRKTTLEDNQFVTRSLLIADNQNEQAYKDMVTLIAPVAVDAEHLKVVPRDSSFVTSYRLDLKKTYELLQKKGVLIFGQDFSKGFAEFEEAIAAGGFEIKTILGTLGDQWVAYIAPSPGWFYVSKLTLVADVRDPEQANRLLRAVENLVKAQGGFFGAGRGQGGVASYQADGDTIYYIKPTSSFMLVSTSWAISNNKLIIGLYPQVVEDACQQLKSKTSILDNPQFATAMKRTLADGPMVYLNERELVRNIYSLFMVLSTFLHESGLAPANGEAALTDLVPSMERLLRYVGDEALTLKAVPDGIMATRTTSNPLLTPMTASDLSPLMFVIALVQDMEIAAEKQPDAILNKPGDPEEKPK